MAAGILSRRSDPPNLHNLAACLLFLLVLYLALVWYAVWKYRRRWQAAIVLLLAPLPVMLTMAILGVLAGPLENVSLRANRILDGLIGFGSVLNLVFVAYIGIMWLVGGIIAVARPSTSRVPCNRCGYDLVGTHELTCPECGGRLSICVQELRMQVYMADQERQERLLASASDAADSEGPKPETPSSQRSSRMPSHLTRATTPERAGTRA